MLPGVMPTSCQSCISRSFVKFCVVSLTTKQQTLQWHAFFCVLFFTLRSDRAIAVGSATVASHAGSEHPVRPTLKGAAWAQDSAADNPRAQTCCTWRQKVQQLGGQQAAPLHCISMTRVPHRPSGVLSSRCR